MPSLEEAVREAVEEFNRYHGAEARAEVVEWLEDRFKVLFSGSFCLTCGFYDYFDDLAQLVGKRGYEVVASKVEELEDGALVEYQLRKGFVERAHPERLVLIFEWRRDGDR